MSDDLSTLGTLPAYEDDSDFKKLSKQDQAYLSEGNSERNKNRFNLSNQNSAALVNMQGERASSGLNFVGSPGIGKSVYDQFQYKEEATPSELENTRSMNQPTWAKLGSGVGKFVTSALSSGFETASAIFGLMSAGIAAANYEDEPNHHGHTIGEEALDAYINNPIVKGVSSIEDAVNSDLPNYRSHYEEENPIYSTFTTANGWASLLETAGYTVGCMYGALPYAKILGSVAKLGKTGKYMATAVTDLVMSSGEAAMEGRQNSEQWLQLQQRQAFDNYNSKVNELQEKKKYAASDADVQDLDRQIDDARNERDARLQAASDDKMHVQTMDFALNMPILMGSNFLTFGRQMANGFKTEKEIAEAAILRDDEKLGKTFGKSFDDVSQDIERELNTTGSTRRFGLNNKIATVERDASGKPIFKDATGKEITKEDYLKIQDDVAGSPDRAYEAAYKVAKDAGKEEKEAIKIGNAAKKEAERTVSEADKYEQAAVKKFGYRENTTTKPSASEAEINDRIAANNEKISQLDSKANNVDKIDFDKEVTRANDLSAESLNVQHKIDEATKEIDKLKTKEATLKKTGESLSKDEQDNLANWNNIKKIHEERLGDIAKEKNGIKSSRNSFLDDIETQKKALQDDNKFLEESLNKYKERKPKYLDKEGKEVSREQAILNGKDFIRQRSVERFKSQMVARQAVDGMESGITKGKDGLLHNTRTSKKAIGKLLFQPFHEGAEEYLQQSAANWSGNTYQVDVDEAGNAARDRKARKEVFDWYSAATQTFGKTMSDAFNDHTVWQQFIAGALMGAFGSPKLRKFKNEKGERQSPITFVGDTFHAYSQYKKQMVSDDETINKLNSILTDKNFRARYEALVRNAHFEDAKQKALSENDNFGYDVAEDKQILSDMVEFDEIGRLDMYENKLKADAAIFENEPITDDDVAKAIQQSTKTVAIKNADGTVTSRKICFLTDDQGNTRDDAKELLKDTFVNNKNKMLETLENYKKNKHWLDSRVGYMLSAYQKKQIVWLMTNANQFRQRCIEYLNKEIFSNVKNSKISINDVMKMLQINVATKIDADVEQLDKILADVTKTRSNLINVDGSVTGATDLIKSDLLAKDKIIEQLHGRIEQMQNVYQMLMSYNMKDDYNKAAMLAYEIKVKDSKTGEEKATTVLDTFKELIDSNGKDIVGVAANDFKESLELSAKFCAAGSSAYQKVNSMLEEMMNNKSQQEASTESTENQNEKPEEGGNQGTQTNPTNNPANKPTNNPTVNVDEIKKSDEYQNAIGIVNSNSPTADDEFYKSINSLQGEQKTNILNIIKGTSKRGARFVANYNGVETFKQKLSQMFSSESDDFKAVLKQYLSRISSMSQTTTEVASTDKPKSMDPTDFAKAKLKIDYSAKNASTEISNNIKNTENIIVSSLKDFVFSNRIDNHDVNMLLSVLGFKDVYELIRNVSDKANGDDVKFRDLFNGIANTLENISIAVQSYYDKTEVKSDDEKVKDIIDSIYKYNKGNIDKLTSMFSKESADKIINTVVKDYFNTYKDTDSIVKAIKRNLARETDGDAIYKSFKQSVNDAITNYNSFNANNENFGAMDYSLFFSLVLELSNQIQGIVNNKIQSGLTSHLTYNVMTSVNELDKYKNVIGILNNIKDETQRKAAISLVNNAIKSISDSFEQTAKESLNDDFHPQDTTNNESTDEGKLDKTNEATPEISKESEGITNSNKETQSGVDSLTKNQYERKGNDIVFNFYRNSAPEKLLSSTIDGIFTPLGSIPKYSYIYDYLKSKGAYDFVDRGNLDLDNSIQYGFMIDDAFEAGKRDSSNQYELRDIEDGVNSKGETRKGEPKTIFITVEVNNGGVVSHQIIGTLHDGNAKNYSGMRELRDKILSNYEASPATTTMQYYEPTNMKLQNILPGIFDRSTNEKGETILNTITEYGHGVGMCVIDADGLLKASSLNIKPDQIWGKTSLKSKKRGTYILVPNGFMNGKQMYSLVALFTKKIVTVGSGADAKYFHLDVRQRFDLETQEKSLLDSFITDNIGSLIDKILNNESIGKGDITKAIKSVLFFSKYNFNAFLLSDKEHNNRKFIKLYFKDRNDKSKEATNTIYINDEDGNPRDRDEIISELLNFLCSSGKPSLQIDADRLNNGTEEERAKYVADILTSGMLSTNLTSIFPKDVSPIYQCYNPSEDKFETTAKQTVSQFNDSNIAGIQVSGGTKVVNVNPSKNKKYTFTYDSNGDLTSVALNNKSLKIEDAKADFVNYRIALSIANRLRDNVPLDSEGNFVDDAGNLIKENEFRLVQGDELVNSLAFKSGNIRIEGGEAGKFDNQEGKLSENTKGVVTANESKTDKYENVQSIFGSGVTSSLRAHTFLSSRHSMLPSIIEEFKNAIHSNDAVALDNLKKKYSSLSFATSKLMIGTNDETIDNAFASLSNQNNAVLTCGTFSDDVLRTFFEDFNKSVDDFMSKNPNVDYKTAASTCLSNFDSIEFSNKVKTTISNQDKYNGFDSSSLLESLVGKTGTAQKIASAMISRGERFYTSKYVVGATFDGYNISGELDVLARTKDGYTRIYDFKTFSVSKNGGSTLVKPDIFTTSQMCSHTKQLNIYKRSCELDTGKGVVGISIIPMERKSNGNGNFSVSFNDFIDLPFMGDTELVNGMNFPNSATKQDTGITLGNKKSTSELSAEELKARDDAERAEKERKEKEKQKQTVIPNGTPNGTPTEGKTEPVESTEKTEETEKTSEAKPESNKVVDNNTNPTTPTNSGEESVASIIPEEGSSSNGEDSSDISSMFSGGMHIAAPASRRSKSSEHRNRDVNNSIEYEVWDKKKEMDWLNSVLPELVTSDKVKILNSLEMAAKCGVSTWGAFMNHMIYIQEFAQKGTLYHETFHFVLNVLLPDGERNKMFDIARKRFGAHKTEIELDELMANEFMEYKLRLDNDDTKYISKNPFARFFNFIKTLLDTVLHMNSIGKLNEFYDKLDKGQITSKRLISLDEMKTKDYFNKKMNGINEFELLTSSEKNMINNSGLSAGEYNKMTQKELDHELSCFGV